MYASGSLTLPCDTHQPLTGHLLVKKQQRLFSPTVFVHHGITAVKKQQRLFSPTVFVHHGITAKLNCSC